jgi:hypothetical protein
VDRRILEVQFALGMKEVSLHQLQHG